ncbi:hypothetical protein NC653_039496 [Populus alba x Populus x berolinensis]|uniref:Uncharacterized protein n=1 Tax=Populus alba x Populus x berolinensis TaxID=444605 RepID=A0AAD6LBF2_9ROSI|nr:hypothetical protein NC653_039496 [Populus alba x Populus x berolinensis]
MACNHNRALNGKPNLLGPLSFGSIGRAAAFSVGLDILSLKNSVPLPLAGLLVLSGGLLGCVALYSFKHLIRLFWVVPSSVLPHCNQLLFLLQYQPSDTCHYTFGYLLQQSYFVVVTRICFVQLIVAPIFFSISL